ncbi:PQQ-binding-like beta-propeller repeat protein [Cellulomonas endometrii]|uniref:outer membrane protein assembly factor BamB family protein n=1 Tax=Cellulomonas endometrii TaxID=3036301 RepID=UPI0024AD44D8|nr:PQQ-binding-like beta-propeller repeat protein [Cellulomonas endometrii]
MGAERMAEVQLDDLAPVQPPRGSATAAAIALRVRALLRRWWPVPVAVVLAAVAWQVVSDGRAESQADRIRTTPGVLAETVTAPLEATPWGTGESMGLLVSATRTADGRLAGVVVPGTGLPAAVVALEPDSGDEAWRVEIGELPDDRGWTRAAACTDGGVEPATTLWCTVTDGPEGDGGPVTTRLVEVDTAAGAVVGSHELAPGSEAVALDGTLVVGTPQPGAVLLVGSDLPSGTERWRTELPDAVSSSYSSGWLGSASGHVLIQGEGGTWAVDPADGRVQAHDDGVYVGRGAELVDIPTAGGTRTRFLGADGSGTAEAEGFPMYVWPDDGSAPTVQPMTAPAGSDTVLRGVDTVSGDVRWERPAETGARSASMVLDGVLYISDLTAVSAVDLETGAELWTTAASPVLDSGVMTDGRHLLRSETAGRTEELVLSAYTLHNGSLAWSTPVPEQVTQLWPMGGALYGYARDGSEMFLVR